MLFLGECLLLLLLCLIVGDVGFVLVTLRELMEEEEDVVGDETGICRRILRCFDALERGDHQLFQEVILRLLLKL
jgi:hypothetical protein